MANSLRPHGLQHAMLPCPSPTQAQRVSDAIQPSHALSSPSPPALNLSQLSWIFNILFPGRNEWRGLVGCRLRGRTESDTTEVT